MIFVYRFLFFWWCIVFHLITLFFNLITLYSTLLASSSSISLICFKLVICLHFRSLENQVIFGTSRGRSLIVSQPTQVWYIHWLHFLFVDMCNANVHHHVLTFGPALQGSFNFYPTHPDVELRLLSGRLSGNGITSLGAHWGVLFIY